MSTSNRLVYCQCCGRDKPHWDYAPGADICTVCAALSPNDACIITRDTVRREHMIAKHTAAGRKASRIQEKLALYAQVGKRCTSCHCLKPVTEFNRCAPQPDGLQPICKPCNKLQVVIKASHGIQAWHAVRDKLRASSPEGK